MRKKATPACAIIPAERIQKCIYVIRGQREITNGDVKLGRPEDTAQVLCAHHNRQQNQEPHVDGGNY